MSDTLAGGAPAVLLTCQLLIRPQPESRQAPALPVVSITAFLCHHLVMDFTWPCAAWQTRRPLTVNINS